MKCYHRLLGISYKDHITNAMVPNKITKTVRPHEYLLTTVKKQYRHVTRFKGFAKTIL